MIRVCLCLIATFFATAEAQRNPTVTTSSGELRGVRESSGFFHHFYAFKGIPYAESPIGDLRFRNPVPHSGWSGVRDAIHHGSHCPNQGIAGIGAGGDEDCLFLNVYTPDLSGNLSVMFWIHGGAFIIGDGNSLVYGPDLIVRENVVVVTINYRLSALGFLSTGDKHAQGNYGLKDMVLALKWVNENIEAFGGNPSEITVFGQSAGGASTHMLLLSEMSRGLFKQAIIQSGTAVSPWVLQTDPLRHAERVAGELGLKYNSTEGLVEELRKVSFHDIMKAQGGIFEMENPIGLGPFNFAPVIEPNDSTEPRFLAEDPMKSLMEGNFQKIPLIIGTTSNEGLLLVREYLLDNEVFDRYNSNDEYLVPLSFNLTRELNSTEILEVADEFRKIYFKGNKISKDMLDGWARYHTDAQFKFPADRTIKYIAKESSEPIYYYNFSFDGALNFLKTLLFLRSYEGACHADDIFYLFSPSFPIPVLPSNHALTVRRRLIRLWTNFAKTGNPTHATDELIEDPWPMYTLEEEEFMDIGHDLVVKKGQKRLDVWFEFQKRFTGHF